MTPHARAAPEVARERVPYPSVALVGYTNAGKSTLFNALTGADVLAEDTLFATLDPTIRALPLAGRLQGRAFRHGRLHLRSADHADRRLPRHAGRGARGRSDPACARHRRRRERAASATDVNAVLAELGVDAEGEPERLLEVWNKADLLDAAALKRASRRRRSTRAHPCLVSAVTGYGLDGAARRDRDEAQSRARHAQDRGSSPRRARCRTGSTRIARWSTAQDLGDGVTHLRIRVAPEKRDRLARLAGPARLGIARRSSSLPSASRRLGLVPELVHLLERGVFRRPAFRAAPPRCCETAARIWRWHRARQLPDRR